MNGYLNSLMVEQHGSTQRTDASHIETHYYCAVGTWICPDPLNPPAQGNSCETKYRTGGYTDKRTRWITRAQYNEWLQ